jgi:tRNA(Arg) A34 adenosine deaminase TadA
MDINRIEFTVTNACTGRCKHCSVGYFWDEVKASIDKNMAVSVVAELSKEYNIQSVMTSSDPTAHAEMIEIRNAGKLLFDIKYKNKCTLYTSVELVLI